MDSDIWPEPDRGAPVALDDELVRYERQLLADQAVQDRLRATGFAVLDVPVLEPDELQRLRALAVDLLDRMREPVGELFLTVGRVQDAGLRAEVSARTAEVVLPRLRPLFVDGAELRGSALQIKPPSPDSELNSHQDSSLVDERVSLGVYAWIALDDTDECNGALHVLPGSHRLGNLQRTLNIPWQLARFGDQMASRSLPLAVPAGHVVLFDAATVHSSPPNRSTRFRLAANAFATHGGTPMLHFFQDGSTTPQMIEVYEIDDSFFRDDDIMERPSAKHRFLGEWPQHRIEWTVEEFGALCDQALAEARVVDGRAD